MTREIVSTSKQDWTTPQWLFNVLHEEFRFTIDLCAAAYNARLSVYFDEVMDGLKQSWTGHRGFYNPPYANVERWLSRGFRESREVMSVGLVPANTDTAWFHKYACHAQIDFFKGRISFEDHTPPEIELARVFELALRKTTAKNMIKLTKVFNEVLAVDSSYALKEVGTFVRDFWERNKMPVYEWVQLTEDRNKPGPGFPSMLVIFDPKHPGPHPFRRRSAKTGMRITE